MTEEQRGQLDEISISNLVEYIAARVGVRRGELTFTIKDGRYERSRASVPISDLKPPT